MTPEEREALRREVWVATWLESEPPNEFGFVDSWGTQARVFASQEAIAGFLESVGKAESDVCVEKQAIQPEVPDAAE